MINIFKYTKNKQSLKPKFLHFPLMYLIKGLGIGGILTLLIAPTSHALTIVTGLDSPQGLAFDSEGDLYVANSGNGTISEISPTGTVSTFATGLNDPTDITFDPSGNLYVANSDYQTTVNKITPSGAVSTIATNVGSSNGIAYDSNNNNLYIATNDGNGIVIVTPSGDILQQVYGFSGNNPSGLTIDSNNILYTVIADSYLDKVNLTTGDITYFTTSSVVEPSALAVDKNDNIYFLNFPFYGIGELTNSGSVLSEINNVLVSPFGRIAVSGNNLYVSDPGTNSILEESLPLGAVPFEFSPSFVCLSALGSFWLIYQLRKRALDN